MPEAKFEDFFTIPDNYRSVDAKVANAVLRIVHGDLQRRMNLKIELESKENRRVRGFQLFFMIHEWNRTTAVVGSMFDLTDLMNVKLQQDDLARFQSKWDYVIAGMRIVVQEEVLHELYAAQLRQSQKMVLVLAPVSYTHLTLPTSDLV